jgi:hypothetical protein
MKILKFIYELPTLPLVLLYGIYACVMILVETPMTDAVMLEEEDINREVKKIMDEFYRRNRIPFHVISIGIWGLVAFKIYLNVTSAS